MCPSEQPTWTIQIAGTNDFWLQMLHHLMFCDHLGSLVGCQAGAGNLVRRFKLIPIVGRERGCMSQSITLENKNSRTWNEQLRWWMLVNRLLLNGLWTICEQYQIHVGYCWLHSAARCCNAIESKRVQMGRASWSRCLRSTQRRWRWDSRARIADRCDRPKLVNDDTRLPGVVPNGHLLKHVETCKNLNVSELFTRTHEKYENNWGGR